MPSRPKFMVRIVELIGMNQNSAEHRLFHETDCFVATTQALWEIGGQIKSNVLAEGRDHILHVKPVDSYEIVEPDVP